MSNHYDSECDSCDTALSIHSRCSYLRLNKDVFKPRGGEVNPPRHLIEICVACTQKLNASSINLWATEQQISMSDVE